MVEAGLGVEFGRCGGSRLRLNPASEFVAVEREEIDHLDWLGELNNQVVGRLKNKMVRHSVSVQMSTPVVTSGSSLDFSSKCDHSSRWIVQWEGGTLMAFLSLNVSPELEFAPPEAESVSDEGSLIFF